MDLRFWADLALIILIVQAFFIMLIAGLVLFFLNRGLAYLLRELRTYSAMARGILTQGQQTVGTAMNAVITPIYAINAFLANLAGVLAGIRKLLTSRQEAP